MRISTGAAALAAVLVLPSAAVAQLSIDATLPGTFMDISTTGTPLSLVDDGEADITTTAGNTLFPAGTVRVGSNGALRFRGAAQELGFTNAAIPSLNAFNGDQTLMPFWDDVNTQGGVNGEIYWQEVSGTLIVQWHDVEFFASPAGETARFQVQVPSTGTTWARMVYDDVTSPRANGGGSATIGYQSNGVGNDVQFSFDVPGSVANGDVLSIVGTFTPPPPPPPPIPVSIVSTLPATWVDISTTGNALSLSDDGEADVPNTVGNAVLSVGTCRVGSNGAVRFDGTGLELGFTNANIPSTAAFNGDRTLMPFWDDINTGGGVNGEIYWQEIGGTLIIQWQDVEFFAGPAGETVRFQVQVHSSGPAIAQFLYDDVTSPRADMGGSATIGFQSGDVAGYDDVEFSFNLPGAVMNGDVLSVVTGPGPIGSNYCMTNPNSTGSPAVISATGSASVMANDLTLVASDMPAAAFGFFLVSPTQGFTPMPGGSMGNLCLTGNIGRYVGPGQIQNSGATNEISLMIDNSMVPGPTGFSSTTAGDVWNFQAWFRDAISGVATSNFTNGLEVTFLP